MWYNTLSKYKGLGMACKPKAWNTAPYKRANGASYNNVLGVPMDLKAHISNYDRGANIEYSDGGFTAGANVNKRNNAKNMDYSVYAKYAF